MSKNNQMFNYMCDIVIENIKINNDSYCNKILVKLVCNLILKSKNKDDLHYIKLINLIETSINSKCQLELGLIYLDLLTKCKPHEFLQKILNLINLYSNFIKYNKTLFFILNNLTICDNN